MKAFIHKFIAAALLTAGLCGVFAPFSEAAPSVSAKSAVLMEANSHNVIFESSGYVKMPMASTTKIMTALVAIENYPLDQVVTISPKAVGVEGSSVYLKAEEQLTMEQLLYAMMLESANDAAAAIAVAVGGSVEHFAEMMNEKAAELGLHNTHFTNPHGLDNEAHYTTAYDLALLASHALKNPDFAKIVSTYKKTIPQGEDNGTRYLLNHNKLLKNYSGVIGVKTGFTKRSGRCLVSAAERDGVILVAVTLSAPDDWNDHVAMLEYGFQKYRSYTAADAGELNCDVPVIGGVSETVAGTNEQALKLCLAVNNVNITSVSEIKRFIPAPVKKGDSLGKVVFYNNGIYAGEVLITAQNDVPLAEIKHSLWDKITDLFD